MQRPLKIGLISDTHDLLRPEARQALMGVDHILHAGDICGREVLDELSSIAPVTAVLGNNDHGAWTDALSRTEAVELGGHPIYMLHDLSQLDLAPHAAGFAVVVCGHSHRPLIDRRDGVLYVNPGSAGPRRFNLPISIGLLELGLETVEPRLLTLVA